MVRWLLLLPCILPLIGVFASPVREKLSINTDMLRKVREQFNETTRDKTARNINFAWRVSYTRTTTLPTKPSEKTTIAIKDIEQNQEEYQKIFSQLTVTLKDPRYRIMWTDLVRKGYSHFISEVKNGGHEMFMKDNKDRAFEGEEGKKFWNKIVGFLETMGEKGFELLLSSVDNTPLKTAQPGGEAQKADVTFPENMRPPTAEPKAEAETPKAEAETVAQEKPTEAPK